MAPCEASVVVSLIYFTCWRGGISDIGIIWPGATITMRPLEWSCGSWGFNKTYINIPSKCEFIPVKNPVIKSDVGCRIQIAAFRYKCFSLSFSKFVPLIGGFRHGGWGGYFISSGMPLEYLRFKILHTIPTRLVVESNVLRLHFLIKYFGSRSPQAP